MSDRSGVGAPMHDGAEPETSGEDEQDETASSATPGRGVDAPNGAEVEQGSAVARAFGRISDSLFGPRDDVPGAPAGVPFGSVDGDNGQQGGPESGSSRESGEETTGASRPRSPARAAAAGRAPEPVAADDEAVTDAAPAPVGPAESRSPADEPAPTPPEATSTTGVAPVVAPAPQAAPARPAPVETSGERVRGPLRARQVHRIVRRVDPWSVLKLSLVFFFCVWLMVLVSAVLVWGVAVGSGTVDGLEGFIERLLAFEEFRFNADQIFRLFAMGGLIMVFLSTAVSAILAVLFNLISDLIGGIRVIVIEEETTRRIIRRG